MAKTTLGSRGYFFLIDSRVNAKKKSAEEKERNNLWSQEYATSFPCKKSVQNLNWVTDWILQCPQGINNIIMALIGYIEQLNCVGLKNRFLRQIVSRSKATMSTMEERVRSEMPFITL